MHWKVCERISSGAFFLFPHWALLSEQRGWRNVCLFTLTADDEILSCQSQCDSVTLFSEIEMPGELEQLCECSAISAKTLTVRKPFKTECYRQVIERTQELNQELSQEISREFSQECFFLIYFWNSFVSNYSACGKEHAVSTRWLKNRLLVELGIVAIAFKLLPRESSS